MADTDSTFLFSGTSFNRKKFAAVFERFKTTKGTEELKADPTFVENENSEIQEERKYTKIVDKKRKRKKTDASAGTVEGFNVFTTSTTEKVDEDFQQAEDKLTQGKKEYYRQLERDAIFRKKHNIYVSGSNVPSPLQSFAELKSRYNCKSFLLRNLAKLGFTEPTPIQRQATAVLLSGRECFACAPTGSGKTFAFVCPILIKLKHASRDGIRALILCPTRELAAQTARECKRLIEGKKFRIKLMTKQLVKSADFTTMPCDILISTPFRVQFAVQKKKLDLSKVEFLVLDESDKLFELGLLEQVDSVVKACSNPSILRSLFSATLPDTVEELARTIMHDAVRITIGQKNTVPESVKQKLVYVGGEDGKLLALEQTFNESLNPPVLVFVQNKERAKELYDEIKFFDYRADVVHADLSEVQREAAVDNFRCGKTWVLIATDVIARGMDFKGVNLVINYDFPDSTTAYIHRIGRTGRAGRSGEAITFYTDTDKTHLRSIANIMKASECEVPAWMTSLPQKRWKKHRPHRGPISTVPDDEETRIRL